MDVKATKIVRIGLLESEALELGEYLEQHTSEGGCEIIDKLYNELEKLGYIPDENAHD